MVFGVEGGSIPVRSSTGAGQDDKGLDGGWSEDGPIVESLQDLQGFLTKLGREVDDVVFADSLSIERRWLGGERLSRRRSLSRYGGLGNGTFFNGPDGFPRDPVKDIGEALFADLGNGLDGPAIHLDVHQIGSGGQIPIPEAMVNHLEMPDALTCLGIQAHQAFGEQVVPGPGVPRTSRWWECSWEDRHIPTLHLHS